MQADPHLTWVVSTDPKARLSGLITVSAINAWQRSAFSKGRFAFQYKPMAPTCCPTAKNHHVLHEAAKAVHCWSAGLNCRPRHEMLGHTAFLPTARVLLMRPSFSSFNFLSHSAWMLRLMLASSGAGTLAAACCLSACTTT